MQHPLALQQIGAVAIDQQVHQAMPLQAEATRAHRFAARRRAMAPEPAAMAADRAFALMAGAPELHGIGHQRSRLHLRMQEGVAEAFGGRSEEHTSELQSLMRNSYAVSCLKKKKDKH